MKSISIPIFSIFALASFAFCPNPLEASLITFNNFDDSTTSGTQNGFTVTSGYATTGNTSDYIYTFSGTGNFDDGFGAATDTFSFDMRYQVYTGSTVDTGAGTVTLGTQANDINLTDQHWGTVGTSAHQVAGNSFRLTVENMNLTTDAGDYVAAFDDNFKFNLYGVAPVEFYLGLTSIVDPLAASGWTSSGDNINLGASGFFLTSNTGGNRGRDLDFSFTTAAVPEPSSALLLSSILGAAGFFHRRRRRR